MVEKENMCQSISRFRAVVVLGGLAEEEIHVPINPFSSSLAVVVGLSKRRFTVVFILRSVAC